MEKGGLVHEMWVSQPPDITAIAVALSRSFCAAHGTVVEVMICVGVSKPSDGLMSATICARQMRSTPIKGQERVMRGPRIRIRTRYVFEHDGFNLVPDR